jgi:hypothetical protein
LLRGVGDIGCIARKLRFDNCPVSPCAQDLQIHSIHAFCYLPLSSACCCPPFPFGPG